MRLRGLALRKKRLGNRIERIRDQRNLSTWEIAGAAGLSNEFVLRVCRGATYPDQLQRAKLAAALKVDESVLSRF